MAERILLNPFQRRGQETGEGWNPSAVRGFESYRAHVKEKEKEETAGPKRPVALREDGETFLSLAELERYREQKVMMAWEAGAYV